MIWSRNVGGILQICEKHAGAGNLRILEAATDAFRWVWGDQYDEQISMKGDNERIMCPKNWTMAVASTILTEDDDIQP